MRRPERCTTPARGAPEARHAARAPARARWSSTACRTARRARPWRRARTSSSRPTTPSADGWAPRAPRRGPFKLTPRRAHRRFVCRAGYKLEAALDLFNVCVKGAVALDAGLSTGGFTDCLLQRGAARVYGVDVGYGQVAERIRTDARVVVMERVNLRHLEGLPEPVDVATLDLSFISVLKARAWRAATCGHTRGARRATWHTRERISGSRAALRRAGRSGDACGAARAAPWRHPGGAHQAAVRGEARGGAWRHAASRFDASRTR